MRKVLCRAQLNNNLYFKQVKMGKKYTEKIKSQHPVCEVGDRDSRMTNCLQQIAQQDNMKIPPSKVATNLIP